MKRLTYTIISIFISIVVLIWPHSVFAHVLKTDGSIGAIMHTDPDDAPVALSPTYFFFEFKDITNKFQPANCNCTFSILEGGKEIYNQSLFANNSSPSLTNASITFIFPQKDVYQVKVVGTPYVSGDFQPFTLIYDVRVDQIANGQINTTSSHNLIYVAAGIVFVGVFLGVVFFKPKSLN